MTQAIPILVDLTDRPIPDRLGGVDAPTLLNRACSSPLTLLLIPDSPDSLSMTLGRRALSPRVG
jgi:hypothetical protein